MKIVFCCLNVYVVVKLFDVIYEAVGVEVRGVFVVVILLILDEFGMVALEVIVVKVLIVVIFLSGIVKFFYREFGR